jgi:hypothetical protein
VLEPSEWKGQLDKEQTEQRARERLSKSEFASFVSVGALDHNTWDAVALGLYELGRFDPVRVIHR